MNLAELYSLKEEDHVMEYLIDTIIRSDFPSGAATLSGEKSSELPGQKPIVRGYVFDKDHHHR